uniref:Putative secreted protein n=1 Tax=Amblyomma triste TaxID=251400 RepID=A0A023G802_AMBTT
MNSLQVLLLLGLVMTFANALQFGPELSEHSQCIAYCKPDENPSGCSDTCVCYRRLDYPKSGYCLDPSKPIPDDFVNLERST